MKVCFFGASLWVALNACAAAADTRKLPDDHAPIGVMGDHLHNKGEWMASYRFMNMGMDGNRDGTDRLDESEVLLSGTGRYRVAPTDMSMTMHMLGLMYATSDNLTLMAMIPYIENDMGHVTTMGGAFNTSSLGLGDISLVALSSFSNGMLWQMGLSFPTGDQNQKDLTPAGNSVLPYSMQIGSGTYDLIAGVGENIQGDSDSWGYQVRGVFRLGENDNDYTQGHQVNVSGWYAKRVSSFISLSVRGIYEYRSNYDGEDSRLLMAQAIKLVPTVDPNLRAGEQIDVALGLNWLHVSGYRFALEYQKPIWQDLDGPQLETDGLLTLGWQMNF
jgi:hypothetical protein